MQTTFLDAEINAAYTRDRVAEIRSMCDLPRGTLELIAEPGPWARIRRQVGTALVAAGERIGGMTDRGPAPTPSAAGRLS